jgi:hypothetical protein
MYQGTPKHTPKMKVGDRVWVYERRAVSALPEGLENLTPLTYVEWPSDRPHDSSMAALRRDDGKVFFLAMGVFERSSIYRIDWEWLPEDDPRVLDSLTADLNAHLLAASHENGPRLHHLREARHLAFVLMRNGRPAPEIPKE